MSVEPRFLRSDQMPAPAGTWLQATNTVWPSAIAGLVCIALGLGAVGLAIVNQAPWWGYLLATLWGGFMALIGWLFWGVFQAGLKPTNWLLRADDSGLFLKIRSFRNHAIAGAEPDVLFLPRPAIAWLRPRKHAARHRASDGNVVHDTQRHLEIKLADDAWLDGIAAQLKVERGLWAGGKGNRGRHVHYPVQVEDGSLHVAWRSGTDLVRPGLPTLLAALARWYPVEAEVASRDRPVGAASTPEQEAQIMRLIEAGETIQAIKLTRELYGLGLKDAKDFVDQLRG